MDAKSMAMEIFNGNNQAKLELEKMLGKKFENMSQEERRIGAACLAVFDGVWNKK
jgi:hypothetical protein